MTRILVTGGARSGKSTLAESLVRQLTRSTSVDLGIGDDQGVEARVDYVATGFVPAPGDAEWAERIRVHRQRRPASWHTIETLDVAGVLGGRVCGAAADEVPVLVDCLGLWITRTIDACQGWDGSADDEIAAAVAALVDAVRSSRRPVVLVTNEVGLGVVPETASGRLFRDWLGRVNMQVAAACDAVALCVCGIPMVLKGTLPPCGADDSPASPAVRDADGG